MLQTFIYLWACFSVILGIPAILIMYFENNHLADKVKRTEEQVAHKNDKIEALYNRISLDEAQRKLELDNYKMTWEESIRQDAIRKSRVVLEAFKEESLAPFTSNFNPKDFQFLGQSMDYIVFDGLQDVKDRNVESLRRVILLEVKTGKADLNKNQKVIRDAIVAGKVAFSVYNATNRTIRTYSSKYPKGEIEVATGVFEVRSEEVKDVVDTDTDTGGDTQSS